MPMPCVRTAPRATLGPTPPHPTPILHPHAHHLPAHTPGTPLRLPLGLPPRYNYTTPKSYLELISLYKQLLQVRLGEQGTG